MIPASHVLAFAAVVTVLIAIPGPSVLFTVSRALTVGRRAALLTVIGNELGLCVQVVAVAFGVGAVVQRSAQVITVVKLAGAVYLAFLGVQAIRHRRSMAEALAARITPVRPLRAIRDGFVVGAANPKTIVFFVAGLPEFISTAPGHLPVPLQMLILGSLFPVIALVLDSAWAAIAGTVRQWLVASPRRLGVAGGGRRGWPPGLAAGTGRRDWPPGLAAGAGRTFLSVSGRICPLPVAKPECYRILSLLTHPASQLRRTKRVTGDPVASEGDPSCEPTWAPA